MALLNISLTISIHRIISELPSFRWTPRYVDVSILFSCGWNYYRECFMQKGGFFKGENGREFFVYNSLWSSLCSKIFLRYFIIFIKMFLDCIVKPFNRLIFCLWTELAQLRCCLCTYILLGCTLEKLFRRHSIQKFKNEKDIHISAYVGTLNITWVIIGLSKALVICLLLLNTVKWNILVRIRQQFQKRGSY